jgi:hypothetical protein
MCSRHDVSLGATRIGVDEDGDDEPDQEGE